MREMGNYNYNYDFSGGNNRNNRNNKKNDEDGDWISWALIAILFATGLWFIALPLLFTKLFAPDKKTQRRDGATLGNVASNVASTVASTAKTVADRAAEAAAREKAGKHDSKARDAAKSVVRSPAMKSSTAKILRIIGVVAAALGSFLLIEPLSAALAGTGAGSSYIQQLLQALSFIVGGAGTFIGGLSMANSIKRYAKYMAVIGTADSMSIESIARKLGRSRKRVAKDLQKMIDKGYLGETAYLNMESGYFFRSGEADAELTALRAAAMKKSADAAQRTADDAYSQALQSIRADNDRIADPVLSEKISRIESITASIFRAVQDNPAKRGQIDTFMNYYLPTTQKLLDSYAQFDSAGVEGENLREAKQRIEATMDSIVEGFERQLDALYKNDAMDVDSDISVMETMLGRESASAARDFKLSTAPAPAKPMPGTNAATDFDLGGSSAQGK